MSDNNKVSNAVLSRVRGGTINRSEPYIRYQLAYGDSLYSLAEKYNTTVATLCDINSISDPEKILAGNYILIPTAP